MLTTWSCGRALAIDRTRHAPRRTRHYRRPRAFQSLQPVHAAIQIAFSFDTAKLLPIRAATMMMGSGSENVNETVAWLFDGERMKRLLALVDHLRDSVIAAWQALAVALFPSAGQHRHQSSLDSVLRAA